MAAEGHDRHLGGVAGPVGRLLEDEGHAPPGQHPVGVGVLGQVRTGQLGRRQVVDVEQVPHQAAPAEAA